MSALPVRREKIVFPNPGVSPEEWYLDVHSSPLTKFAPMLPMIGGLLFGGIMLVFLIVKHANLLALDASDVLLGMAFWPGVIIFAGWEKLITNKVSKKKELHRREHANLLIDALEGQGWTIESKQPVDTLVEDDHPYFYSQKNSFRYKTYQKDIQDKLIYWTFELSDDKAERLIKDDAKQKQIARMTAEYEKEHGPLSPEKKATFQNALKLTL